MKACILAQPAQLRHNLCNSGKYKRLSLALTKFLCMSVTALSAALTCTW